MDAKRHLIGKLYLDTAKMSWNGNMLEGAEAVQQGRRRMMISSAVFMFESGG